MLVFRKINIIIIMGNLLIRKKKYNAANNVNELENLQILVQVLRLENEKLKSDLNNSIIKHNDIEEKLQKYMTLSSNLQNRIGLENSFWDLCDYSPAIKDDHNNFINSHYLESRF
jgi:hypothetical protein